jgi:hypothetical protein
MKRYKEFRPSTFDVAGLNLPDRQNWLVAPVTINRDSDLLEESNWNVVVKDLRLSDDNQEESDVEIHRFRHWACGWFEICLVRPGSKAEEKAREWESALAEYPIACENDYSERENEAVCKYWAECSIKERMAIIKDSRSEVSIFAARRKDLPCDLYETVRDIIN